MHRLASRASPALSPPLPRTWTRGVLTRTRLDSGGEAYVDSTTRLLEERVVLVAGPITDATAASVCAQLLVLEAESPRKPIDVYIHSPGGSVSAGLAVYDTMRYVACDVRTLVLGEAFSMAAVLLCAGARRAALPNARVMLHQPSGSVVGTAEAVSIQAEQILDVRRRLNAIVAKHTGQPVDVVERALRADYFLTAQEALAFGVVDEIIEKRGAKPVTRESLAGSGAGLAPASTRGGGGVGLGVGVGVGVGGVGGRAAR